MPDFEFPPLISAEDGTRLGRCPKEGYERGWGLQFTDLPAKIRDEENFQQALGFAQGRTIVPEERLMNLYLLIRYYLPRLEPGHIVEFGSYRGGSALFMASLAQTYLPGTKVYALDTYEGMPTTDKTIDAHNAGDFADTSADDVQAAAKKAGLSNLLVVKGDFQFTVNAVMRQAQKVRLSHIDCDIYSALKYAYEGCEPYMVRGGYVVFDDANYSSCLGATEMIEQIVIRRDGLSSEQVYPHVVFRVQALTR
jgi:hypothetical protein